MKIFSCSACGQVLFFENSQCTQCGHVLAYLPDQCVVSALEPVSQPGVESGAGVPATYVALSPSAKGSKYRLCGNYIEHGVCNWAVPAGSADTLCRACTLNVTIPNLSLPGSKDAWAKMEVAKRRLVYGLLELGLPVEARGTTQFGLGFEFKQDQPGNKVFTGHSDGLIVINIAEADDPFREKMRQDMGEPYRTVLGHFRHEIGHYYWDCLVRESRWLEPFRELFGDETVDYQESLNRHYENGAPADWALRFVSTYASMHPWEDWAETFAHYLHMVDTLETAGTYGLALRPKLEDGGKAAKLSARRLDFEDFDDLIAGWVPLTVALNSLNRGMGLPDLYPFVLSNHAIDKLRLVHQVIEDAGAAPRSKPSAEKSAAARPA